MQLATYLSNAARRFPTALALLDEQVRWTYQQLYNECITVAAHLQQMDLSAGDHVLIILKNRRENVVLYWACQILGLVYTPLNFRMQSDEIAFCIGDAQPQIISQLLARLLRTGEDPARAVSAPRLTLDARSAGPFRLWWGDDLTVLIEADAPAEWFEGLAARGHRIQAISAFDPVAVGCAQIIAVEQRAGGEQCLVAASDPRSPEGAAVAR